MIPTSQTKATTKSRTYRNQRNPWCIIRPLPNTQWHIIARYRRRNDAESHLQVLRRLMPIVPFEIVFDIMPNDSDQTACTPKQQ